MEKALTTLFDLSKFIVSILVIAFFLFVHLFIKENTYFWKHPITRQTRQPF